MANKRLLITVFGLTLLMSPVLQLLLCYNILPEGKKWLMVFPITSYTFGNLSSFFPVVTEAPIATGYFWIILFLLLFKTKSTANNIVLIILSLPLFFTQESLSFLSPVLAPASVLKMKKAANRGERLTLGLLTAIFVAVGIYQTTYILNPRDINNRNALISQLLQLKWIYQDGINISSLLAIPFFLTSGLAFSKKKIIQIAPPVLSLFISAGITLLFLLNFDWYGMKTQFAARYNCTFFSLFLSIMALFFLYSKKFNINPLKTIATSLIIYQLGIISIHTIAIIYWKDYTVNFKRILKSCNGFINYSQALKELKGKQKENFVKMSWSWTNPTISILLQGKEIHSIILNPENCGWEPFHPCREESLKSQIRNENITPLINILRTRGCTCIRKT